MAHPVHLSRLSRLARRYFHVKSFSVLAATYTENVFSFFFFPALPTRRPSLRDASVTIITVLAVLLLGRKLGIFVSTRVSLNTRLNVASKGTLRKCTLFETN